MAHQPRLDYLKFRDLAPDVQTSLLGAYKAIGASGLDKALVNLIEIRVSQINGCAFCVQLHTVEGRKHGISEERLQLLCVWREAPVYSEAERAALEWAEALTRIAAEGGVPDPVYADLKTHFSDRDIA